MPEEVFVQDRAQVSPEALSQHRKGSRESQGRTSTCDVTNVVTHDVTNVVTHDVANRQ